MTFGKRSIVTGFFSKEDIYAPNVNLGGSQLDLAKFEIVRQQMENLNLIEQVAAWKADAAEIYCRKRRRRRSGR